MRAQEEVMFGPDGALAGVYGGSIVIDLTTVSLTSSLRGGEAEKCSNDRCYCIWQRTTRGSGQPCDLRRRRAHDL